MGGQSNIAWPTNNQQPSLSLSHKSSLLNDWSERLGGGKTQTQTQTQTQTLSLLGLGG